nr:MAG TPA: hypothetical protein [Caudoviricetes sp.]
MLRSFEKDLLIESVYEGIRGKQKEQSPKRLM